MQGQITLNDCENLIIMGNICSDNVVGPGIHLNRSSDNIISGNSSNNNVSGIYIGSSNSNNISGNITTNNSSSGIYISESINNTITGNNCIRGEGLEEDYTEGQNTIILVNSSYNFISSNNCKGKDIVITGGVGNIEPVEEVKTYVDSQDALKADKTYVDSKVKTDVPVGAQFTDTVTTINGKTGVIAKADIVALGIPAQDTVYTHPANHPASMITETSLRRFVSDNEKAIWNSKGVVD